MQSVLITGGADFIGQNQVQAWHAARPADRLMVVDATTWRDVTSGAYKAWIDKNYSFRIAV
jgi:dTDP-D-glucose 4,6-dehydratase